MHVDDRAGRDPQDAVGRVAVRVVGDDRRGSRQCLRLVPVVLLTATGVSAIALTVIVTAASFAEISVPSVTL